VGFLVDMIAEKRSEVGLSGLKSALPWLVDMLGGSITAAGTRVDQQKALGVTAVYSCVRIIAWVQASLPLHVYRRLQPRGKEKDTQNPLYKLLHDAPNPEQTSFEWRSFMSAMQNLWGAGVSEIEYDGSGRPIALWPIPTWCVEKKRIVANRQLFYQITIDGRTFILRPEQVLVFPALSINLDSWLSPISQHRETIGAALAVKEFGARVFGQGTNPSGILSGLRFPKDASEESIRKKFSEKYEGLGNASRLMLLEEGIKFDRIGMPPQDAQYLETRRFDISEIARIFNVPLFLLQETTGSTSWGSGLEELNLAFVAYCLRPYLVQWEQEINRRLLKDDDQHFVEFLLEGLLRGKMSERYQAYATARQWGWKSANDIKEIENENPLPGEQGDIYLVPMNMVDAKNAGKVSTLINDKEKNAPQGGK
jgi:HK97 family phage portal protein